MISPKIIYYFLQPFSFLHLFQNKKTKMVTKNFLPRLKLLRWIEHITVEKVVSFSWWGQSERVKIKFIFPHLNHATQCVPLPEASSKFKIAHSFLLGRVGKVSLKKTPRKFFKPIFLPHLQFQSCSEACLVKQYFQLGYPFILNDGFQFREFQIHLVKPSVCFIPF